MGTLTGILAVSPWEGFITLTDGQRINITNWLLGDTEVGGPAYASSFVAGPDADGQWYAASPKEEDFDDDDSL